MITINEVDPADVCEDFDLDALAADIAKSDRALADLDIEPIADYTPTQCERCRYYERADWSVGISESCSMIDYDADPAADIHEMMLFDDARQARCEFYAPRPKQHTANVYALYADLYTDEMITDATRILHNVS